MGLLSLFKSNVHLSKRSQKKNYKRKKRTLACFPWWVETLCKMGNSSTKMLKFEARKVTD